MTTGRRYRVVAQTLAKFSVTGLYAPDFIGGGQDKSRLGWWLVFVAAVALDAFLGLQTASSPNDIVVKFNALDASPPRSSSMLGYV